MKTLNAIDMIESIEKKIIEMENKSFYETNSNDTLAQLNIYKSYMIRISAEISVLKDIVNGAEVSK